MTCRRSHSLLESSVVCVGLRPLERALASIFYLTLVFSPGLAIGQQVAPTATETPRETTSGEVVRQVDELIAEHFYRSDFDFDAWLEATSDLHQQARTAPSNHALASVMNRLLATLEASHTAYFGKNYPQRYQILGLFATLFPDLSDVAYCYPGIGILVDPARDPQLVLAALDGFPASEAGLRFGDRIESVNGQPFHPIESFRGMEESSVAIAFRRDAQLQHVDVQVVSLDGRTMFHTALEASVRIYQRDAWKIGYLHAWSYAGSQYQELIRETLLWGKLADCDAVVLDLRDGWGGADLNYLNLFREPIAIVSGRSRNGPARSFSGVWEKPVHLLVNKRSTSGKELLAYGFKKLGLGKIVGGTTAGAVLAGRIFRLANGDVLYLAVQSIRVDGQPLEGRGVSADIEVTRKPGTPEDEPLEACLEDLVKVLDRANASVSDSD